MKLSIVIICWNDLKVIQDCIRSIYAETEGVDYEIIVSDNGSNDGSLDHIRSEFPGVRIVENGANLGFAKGNNSGINATRGEYVLILNPDTIILDKALDKLLEFASLHPEAGAFGCRVLNPDGTYQNPARPLPSNLGFLVAALNMRWLGMFSKMFESDTYYNWEGRTERMVGYQSGCCVLVRAQLLKDLGGFDERFFYHFEETDLCCRVWESGSLVLFCPQAEITHLGGQSVGRFPIRFTLETYRGQFRYFYKHFGIKGVVRARRILLLHLSIRAAGYALMRSFKNTEELRNRLQLYKVALRWNWALNPRQFIEHGVEPDVGYLPLAAAPDMTRKPLMDKRASASG